MPRFLLSEANLEGCIVGMGQVEANFLYSFLNIAYYYYVSGAMLQFTQNSTL